MKPRNFPTRKARRQAAAAERRGEALTQSQAALLQEPKNIRIRKGSAGWARHV